LPVAVVGLRQGGAHNHNLDSFHAQGYSLICAALSRPARG
jgi:hypothetical protein